MFESLTVYAVRLKNFGCSNTRMSHILGSMPSIDGLSWLSVSKRDKKSTSEILKKIISKIDILRKVNIPTSLIINVSIKD